MIDYFKNRVKRKALYYIVVISLVSGVISEATLNITNFLENTASTVSEYLPDVPKNVFAKDYSISDIPKWDGKAYVLIDGNMPSFSKKAIKKAAKGSYTKYKPLDDLGRTRSAIGSLSTETINYGDRAEIGMIKPSGWETKKYPDIIADRYLYNRCHLLMQKAAAGWDMETCNSQQNLITGTRYLNVDGMLFFEEMVINYLYSHEGNHVLYRVTPVYKGDNLVCSGVHMEAYSVEDEGGGVCFNVYCYNVQPGIKIDYKTGASKKKSEEKRNAEIQEAKKNSASTVV